jgi:hypothetical protein
MRQIAARSAAIRLGKCARKCGRLLGGLLQQGHNSQKFQL